MDSPFEVLGLAPDADEDAVERAYRRRVKEVHPDQGGSMEAFLLVRSAYEAITTEQRQGDGVGVADVEWPDPASDVATDDDGWTPETRVEYLAYDAVVERGWSLDDPDLFQKAADADLDPPAWGRITVDRRDPLLEAVEDEGFAWPFACRGGACANCAVAVHSGDLTQPVDHVLPEEMVDRGIRLSCLGHPTGPQLKVVYGVKEMADLEELTLPADRFERSRADD